jgi:diamine N-acetyltransferase
MNVKLRPLQLSDAYTSVKWRNIPNIWKYTTFAPGREIKIQDELAWMDKVLAEKDTKRFAILADDAYVGNVYLTNLTATSGEYHIFIGDENYWGKGIARKASNLIIKVGHELGLKEIVLGVNKENVPAMNLYKSLGFEVTGEENGFIRMALNIAEGN